MTPLRQVPHLIRMELARNQLLLLILALALGVAAGMELLPPMPTLLPSFAALLGLHLIWIVFVARVVQADPVRGDRAQWRTLPISGWALFWSKFILIVVAWIVLVIATQLPWLVGIEVVWTDLATPALVALPSLILVVALALVTPNFKVFATLGIVTFVGISVVESLRSPAQGASGAVVPIEIAEPATAPLASEHRLRIARYRVDIRPMSRQASAAQVHLNPAPSADPIAHLLMAPEVERYLPSGDTVRGSLTDHVWSIRAPELPLGDSVRWLGPAGPPPDTTLSVGIPMDGLVPGVRTVPDDASIPEPGSSGRFRARIEALRPARLVTIPLEVSEMRTPRRRWQMIGATIGAEGPEVRIRLIEAPGMALPEIGDPRTTSLGSAGLARRDAVTWVLHHPERGEAVRLVGYRREQQGDARTGSIRTLVLISLQNDLIEKGWVDGWLDPPPPLPIDRAWMDGAVLHVFQWKGLGVQELTLGF